MDQIILTNYQCEFQVDATREVIMDRIGQVEKWWCSTTQGSPKNSGDSFRIVFGQTWVDFQVQIFENLQKVIWKVTDCHLHWLEDKKEWQDSRLVFEISPEAGKNRVTITHEGLTPALACFEDCRKGWDFFAGQSLPQLIQTGKGQPDQMKADR